MAKQAKGKVIRKGKPTGDGSRLENGRSVKALEGSTPSLSANLKEYMILKKLLNNVDLLFINIACALGFHEYGQARTANKNKTVNLCVHCGDIGS